MKPDKIRYVYIGDGRREVMKEWKGKKRGRSAEVSRVEYKYSRDYKVTLFCFLLPISCDRTQKEAYY